MISGKLNLDTLYNVHVQLIVHTTLDLSFVILCHYVILRVLYCTCQGGVCEVHGLVVFLLKNWKKEKAVLYLSQRR